MRLRVVAVAAILTLSAVAAAVHCSIRASRLDRERIVFEVRSVNHGIGFRDNGYFVTRAGQVHRFNFHPTLNDRNRLVLPTTSNLEDVLKDKGTVEATVAQIPESIMREMLALVPATNGGVLACNGGGADRGSVTYSARERNGNKTLLASESNSSCTNTAPEAFILVAWLYKYVSASYGTAFHNSTGCINTADVTRALRDNRCSPFTLLVQAADGTQYCTQRNPRCRNDNGCDCNGDDVCAAGRSHCQELGPGALRCVP
jgi:hypothetical protein